MSEEMNLYKRCKNIFKAHGVDMGGGSGGGELDIIVDIRNGSDPVLIKGDYEAVASKIDSGMMVNGVVTAAFEESGDTTHMVTGVFCGNHIDSSEGEEIDLVFYFAGAGTMLCLAFYPDGSLEINE